jgi:hypothetical protein
LAHDAFREANLGRIKPTAHVGQHLPPPHQGLAQQASAARIQEVEQHVPHRAPLLRLADPPRLYQSVPT